MRRRFMKTKQSKLLYFLSGIYIVTLLYAFVINIETGNLKDIMMCFVACLTPWLFPLFMRVLHFKMTDEIEAINIIFIYFASLVGSALAGYTWPFYDKIVHFFSGILASIIAMILYCMIKKQRTIDNKQDYILFFIFIMTVNLSIAVVWEFYEYFMLIFFNDDCIHHYTTGVHDSMTDMLCALGGGCLVLLGILRAKNQQKSNVLIRVVENFYDLNTKELT